MQGSAGPSTVEVGLPFRWRLSRSMTPSRAFGKITWESHNVVQQPDCAAIERPIDIPGRLHIK